MGHYKYERLSARDNDFLQWESPRLPMHAGSTQVFAPGPLGGEDGGVDFQTIKRGIEGILHKIPRYREKLAWIPGEDHAVWIDDKHFNLDYHMRHTALPCPGDDDQLKQLVARILERPLDRSRPLWEFWVVEGLRDGRFATIGKVHYCMLGGGGGMALAGNLLSGSPDYKIPEPHRFVPRPAPTTAELRRDERMRLLGLPLRALAGAWDFARRTENVPLEIGRRVRGVGELALWKVVPASDSPLNGRVGPHRVFDWLMLSLEDVEAVGDAVGCSPNDVILGALTGAVREYMVYRQVDPAKLDFRVASPVEVREGLARSGDGDRVSSWVLRLPVGEPDPLEQIAVIHKTTERLRKSHQAAAIEMVEAVHEWIPIDFQGWSSGTQNTYVTSVLGPRFPLYLLGAELLELYIQPPLIENLGLAVGTISYNGRVCWGFNADYDRIADIDVFVDMVQKNFERLAEAADVKVSASSRIGAPARGRG